MGLSEKVTELERGANAALTVAQWWKSQIATRGEPTAEAFYKSLGLNHLETKSKVEFDGLTLSREPNEVEKLCVKSIATAQDASKASVAEILLKLRTELIDDGIKAIKKLAAADYHTLVLTAPEKIRDALREDLGKVFDKGRRLVAEELGRQAGKSIVAGIAFKQTPEDEDELDGLTDLTDSRVVNDVQSRITAAAQRFALLGLTGAALTEAIRNEIETGSISYIDRAAQGVANRVLNFGRMREMEDRGDEIDRFEQSAILDASTCDPCFSDDGKTASDPSDLPGGPNPDCLGSDYCRCFIVAILDTVA